MVMAYITFFDENSFPFLHHIVINNGGSHLPLCVGIAFDYLAAPGVAGMAEPSRLWGVLCVVEDPDALALYYRRWGGVAKVQSVCSVRF